LNINNARVVQIEPQDKLWFAIENGTLYALPLYGDYPGPFYIQFQQINNHSYSSKSTHFFFSLLDLFSLFKYLFE